MMCDHIWLLDLQTDFKGFKYIIKVSPPAPATAPVVDPIDVIKDVKATILDVIGKVKAQATATSNKVDLLNKTYNNNQSVLDSQMLKVLKSLKEADERAKIEKEEKENKKKLLMEKAEAEAAKKED